MFIGTKQFCVDTSTKRMCSVSVWLMFIRVLSPLIMCLGLLRTAGLLGLRYCCLQLSRESLIQTTLRLSRKLTDRQKDRLTETSSIILRLALPWGAYQWPREIASLCAARARSDTQLPCMKPPSPPSPSPPPLLLLKTRG